MGPTARGHHTHLLRITKCMSPLNSSFQVSSSFYTEQTCLYGPCIIIHSFPHPTFPSAKKSSVVVTSTCGVVWCGLVWALLPWQSKGCARSARRPSFKSSAPSISPLLLTFPPRNSARLQHHHQKVSFPLNTSIPPSHEYLQHEQTGKYAALVREDGQSRVWHVEAVEHEHDKYDASTQTESRHSSTPFTNCRRHNHPLLLQRPLRLRLGRSQHRGHPIRDPRSCPPLDTQ